MLMMMIIRAFGYAAQQLEKNTKLKLVVAEVVNEIDPILFLRTLQTNLSYYITRSCVHLKLAQIQQKSGIVHNSKCAPIVNLGNLSKI